MKSTPIFPEEELKKHPKKECDQTILNKAITVDDLSDGDEGHWAHPIEGTIGTESTPNFQKTPWGERGHSCFFNGLDISLKSLFTKIEQLNNNPNTLKSKIFAGYVWNDMNDIIHNSSFFPKFHPSFQQIIDQDEEFKELWARLLSLRGSPANDPVIQKTCAEIEKDLKTFCYSKTFDYALSFLKDSEMVYYQTQSEEHKESTHTLPAAFALAAGIKFFRIYKRNPETQALKKVYEYRIPEAIEPLSAQTLPDLLLHSYEMADLFDKRAQPSHFTRLVREEEADESP